MMNAQLSIVALILFGLITPGCKRTPSGDADVNRGLRLMEKREFAEAIPHLEKGLKLPLRAYEKSEILTSVGNCYNELEFFTRSLEYHEMALEADPKNHQAHVNMGVVYRLRGDYEKAAECYEKAIAIAPNYAEAHASIGALAMFQDDVSKAIVHLEKSIALNDTVAVAHSNLAIAYAVAGRFDEADAQLKKAILRGYHQPDVVRSRIDALRNDKK